MSSPSVSASATSSSSQYLLNPPTCRITTAKKAVIEKLEYLRKTSSAFMIAALVAVVAGGIMIGLAQANYVPIECPFYAFGACVPLILTTIALDCCLRSFARKNNIDPDDYFRTHQRPDSKPKDPKAKKTA